MTNKLLIIALSCALALALALVLVLAWRTRKSSTQLVQPTGPILNTTLDLDPPSKVDNIMVEADLPENFDYFIELLVKKLNETAKEIATKKSNPSQYKNGLISSAVAKFKELNNSISDNKNGKLLVKALSESNQRCSDMGSISEDEDDVEQLIDLNENLITVVYPCLLN